MTIKKTLLFTMMLAVFLDVGNFFMPMPVYTPLFFHSSFLSGYSHEAISILLGVLVACYGFAQLFGGPFFGDLSDQYGRKKILILSLVLSTLGCILGGISLSTNNLFLVFISRLIIGFASGTISIIFALAADYSTKETSAKNLGYVTVGTSVGAALGPVIGGHLAHINYSTPFYLMSGLYLLTALLMLKLLPNEPATRNKTRLHIFNGIKNIFILASRSRYLCFLIVSVLLFQIGAESFYLAAPILAVKKFNMHSGNIGNYLLLLGIASFISSSYLNKYLSKYFSSIKAYIGCTLLFASAVSLLIFTNTKPSFTLPFIAFGFFGTLSWIHSNNLFSLSVDETEQGLAMGVGQAMWSAGGIFGAIIIGFSSAINYNSVGYLPVIFELAAFVMAIVIYKLSKE